MGKIVERALKQLGATVLEIEGMKTKFLKDELDDFFQLLTNKTMPLEALMGHTNALKAAAQHHMDEFY